jgi:hypothetical protein
MKDKVKELFIKLNDEFESIKHIENQKEFATLAKNKTPPQFPKAELYYLFVFISVPIRHVIVGFHDCEREAMQTLGRNPLFRLLLCIFCFLVPEGIFPFRLPDVSFYLARGDDFVDCEPFD